LPPYANVAQPAERLIRNEQVNGSIPFIGSIDKTPKQTFGAMFSGILGGVHLRRISEAPMKCKSFMGHNIGV
jgi:hypothetical protein